MSAPDDARQMLDMAEKDLRALQGMRDREIFVDEVFGFHAQQAIEKSLKAWIAALGEAYPLTHDIGDLLIRLEDLGQDVEPFWDLVGYTAFGARFRYQALEVDEADSIADRAAAIVEVQVLFEHAQRTVTGRIA